MKTKRFQFVGEQPTKFCERWLSPHTAYGIFAKTPWFCENFDTGEVRVLIHGKWVKSRNNALNEFVSELIVRNGCHGHTATVDFVVGAPSMRKPTAYDAKSVNRNGFAVRSWTAENFNAVCAPSMPHTTPNHSTDAVITEREAEAKKKIRALPPSKSKDVKLTSPCADFDARTDRAKLSYINGKHV